MSPMSGSSSSSQRKALQMGDRVHARWPGNGCWYLAVVERIDDTKVTVAWDDGDTNDRVVDIKDVVKVTDDSRPSSWQQIEDSSFVEDLPGKGRCLFTRHYVKSGSVLFIEKPTLVAIPSKNRGFWDALVKENEKEAFQLGTTSFHYAAVLTWFTLEDADVKVVLDKFVPDGENEETSRDVIRILELLDSVPSLSLPPGRAQLTGRVLQNLVNAWRYNSFGHHSEDGLVLYNRISMAAHGCDPTCCWTYGDDESFVLRARVTLQPGAEVTISYLQDEDLLKSTNVRRKKLENWKFRCSCSRCNLRVDVCRGFRCLKCRSGAHYFVENGSTPQLTACDVCAEACKDAEKEQCLSLEPEYVARIEQLDKNNPNDVELVYNASLDFFHENHWCVFVCDHLLWEYYRERDNDVAMIHAQRKVQYHARVYPRPTFVWAWGLEELADDLQKQIQQAANYKKLMGASSHGAAVLAATRKNHRNSGSRYAEIINMYRKSQCQLAILCGPAHPYAVAPQNKWHAAQQNFNSICA
ncbi:unnamed protein product [Amoebophrya sp. A120]|nr:unnamed protein product [Amoebophrya sp. A120]|eukprot:GSA120T00005489001.1